MYKVKRAIHKILYSPFFYVAAFAVFSFFIFNSRIVFTRALTVWRENKELEEKIRESEKTNLELAAEIEYARSAGFREREGKSRLNLKQPGEDVIVIVPPRQVATATPEGPSGIWKKITGGLKALFGM